MRKKKTLRIVIHKSPQSLDGNNLAYYIPVLHEIHILSPNQMFKKVLKHEEAHSRSPIGWTYDSTWNPYLYLMLSAIVGITFVSLGLRSSAIAFIASIATILSFSQFFYWLEELRAERKSR